MNIVWVSCWTETPQTSSLSRGFDSQSTDSLSHQLPVLEQALTQHLQCWLITKDQRKQLFSPISSSTTKGTWRLVGVSEGGCKAYPLSSIALVELSQQTFTRDALIQRQIDTDPTLWRSGMIEVLLKASASIAINFQHRRCCRAGDSQNPG